MSIKHATILHPCQFTRLGLSELLPSSCRVLSSEKIHQCHLHLLSVNKPNLFIISLQGSDYTVMDILSFIEIIFQESHQHRVIIILDVYRSSGLIDYLLETCARIGFIDTQNSLSSITRQINELMSNDLLEFSEYFKKVAKPLSLRERQVLNGILMEFDYKKISQVLSISPKLVGHYKRKALKKLGIRTIQSLLIPTNQLFRISPVLAYTQICARL
ncbi:Bacterial regulatory proteins, luxR family [Serratia fonticola]|uniref:response regulator transcription factor n=1 Tax=Serratia fonticola TaxID=47917 RepID=UPI00192AE93C|nr:LuxR C-terminal-related transcriptional regulator [Serratia fonticola]MBL5903990.1 helix-turn-helix transcriptional regulator [Serratia fonticola]CAI2084649.1 Bacterial regulatory proteins, luxR family [Serratia fonticola]